MSFQLTTYDLRLTTLYLKKMNESKISVRYAKAFFALSQEKNILAEISEDVKLLHEMQSDANFRILLTDPTIRTQQKKDIFKAIFAGKINEITLKFLNLIAENGREDFLGMMILNFLTLYRKHTGIEDASITTTGKLDTKIKESLKDFIETYFKTKIKLTEKTDEELIGGFLIRVGDKQLDASVSRKLEDAKKSLLLESTATL